MRGNQSQPRYGDRPSQVLSRPPGRGAALTVGRPANHLALALLAALCFPPVGIFAVLSARKVDDLWAAGQYAESHEASANAKRWARIATATTMTIVVLGVLAAGDAIGVL